MNVKDLMDVLKDKDPNAIVVINSYGGRGVNEVGKASACEIWLDVSQSWYNGKHMVVWGSGAIAPDQNECDTKSNKKVAAVHIWVG